MSLKYPESVKDHARELRRDFHIALAASKGVRTKLPISEHVSNLIRGGIRQGFAEGLSQNKCSIFHSKQEKREVEDMILSQISSELFGKTQASIIPEVVSRATLRSLHASFDDLAHKYEARPANLGATMQSTGTNEHTAPASPAETKLKMEAGSSSPPDWEQIQNSPTLNKANDKAIVVSLVNNLIGPDLNNVELTRLVNQSIGSDPEIPSHLSDSEWITGANLLDSGEIEVHTETEDDRDFLALNTHWRPKLEQTLAARKGIFMGVVDEFSFERSHSMLRAYEESAITRVDDVEDLGQDMTETMVPLSRPGQASQAFEKGISWESEDGTFFLNDQPHGCLTTESEQSYEPHQGSHVFKNPSTIPSHHISTPAQLSTYTEFVGRPQPTSIETTIGHTRRALSLSTFPFLPDTTKRLKVTMDEQ